MNYAEAGINSPRPSRPPALDYEHYDLMAEDGDEGATAIDIRSIFAALYRNRFYVLGIMLVAILLGFATIFLATPRYRATASVQIDQRTSKVLGTEDADPIQAGTEADRFLQTQVDILNSRAIAIRVAQDLKLFGSDRFLAAMGAKPSVPDDAGRRRVTVLGLLQGNLHVTLPRNSRVVQISFDSRDPSVAAEVANTYSTSFIYSNLQRRFSASQYSREFLERQLAQTKARLEQSERGLIAYARSAGLIDASAGSAGAAGAEGPRSLVTANLVDLNQAYAAARAARIQAQQRWEEASAAPLMSLPEVLGNPAVQQLTQRRAELQGELEQLRQRLKPDHPTVKQEQAQIQALEEQIRDLANGLLTSLRNQFRIAEKQENALQTNLTTLKGQTLAEQNRGIQYNILKREVDTNRELYNGLLQRYKEVSAEAGITSNNVTVVDTAEAPRVPIWPRPMINLALAILVGLAVAAAFVLAKEKLDDVVRAPTDVETKLGVPLLGIVPLLKGGQTPLEALREPRSAMVEAHHTIRTALELASDQGLPRTVLITSSRQGEGKSTSSYALARDLASSGRRVLLIDADLRKPSLHRLLGTDNARGLSTVLARRDNAAEAVRKMDDAGLDFLSSGPIPPDPGQLLSGGTLPAVLEAFGREYDAVILDGPPLLALSDAVRLGATVGATIFVVEANGSHHGSVKHALRRLFASHAQVAGAILTKYDAKQAGYGATDYGYYSYNE